MERGKTFPVSAIWVDRAKRQRKELTGIEELASSIQRAGHLIHPITIRRDGELIAGERRWTAIKLLGWDNIDVQFLEDMGEAELKLIELEENVARVDLEWQDQCRAVYEYHNTRKALDPDWNQERTAAALNLTSVGVGQKIAVAIELLSGNKMVAEAPKFSTARGIVTRAAERKRSVAIAQVAQTINPVKAAAAVAKAQEVPLINTDFSQWLSSTPGTGSINFVHCDFPYGVGMHKSAQGGGSAFGTYEDTPDVYWTLLNVLESAMSSHISESAHLMFWFSMDFYESTKTRLESMGWNVNPFPLIWNKTDNTGIIPDAQRGPRRIYETAFIASRGDRLIVRATSNVFSCGSGDKTLHMNQKPVEMLQYFFGMFVDESTTMLDPTCGSASAVRAAKNKGAASVLGLERDKEFYARAVEAFNK
jgi:ParB/RepB/Spo0J family partition protein